MADDLTQDDSLQRLAPLLSQPAPEVGRAEDLASRFGTGVVSSVAEPVGGAYRLLEAAGVPGAGRGAGIASQILRDQRITSGVPIAGTNPAYDKDFVSGVATGLGRAPATIALAEAGLPALIAGGALSGGFNADEAQRDYQERAAAGQLSPGEEPPPGLAAEATRQAISNAIFPVAGAVGGAVVKPILSATASPAARAILGYTGTVGGNLLGSAAVRKAETGKFGYENPAQFGEDLTASGVTFGILPTQHLLERAPFKPRETTPAQAAAETAANPPSVVKTFPVLSLSPMATEVANTSTAITEATKPASVPEAPYLGPTPGQQHAINLGGQQLASNFLGEAETRAETLPSNVAFTNQDRQAAARVDALYRARQQRDFLQGFSPEAQDLATSYGIPRNELISHFNEAIRILESGEPVKSPIARQQELATQAGKPVAETPLPADTTQTSETTPSNETRNVEERPASVGQVNGPDGLVNPPVLPEGGLRRNGELGTSPQEGPLLEPGSNAPVDQANDPNAGLRGQGELGGEPTQRPVLDAPVPESPATLEAQREQLAEGRRPAVLYTPGEEIPPVPDGFDSVTTPNGTYHFNPEIVSKGEVMAKDATGRQNELLNLGPENKADVAAAEGTPVAVTERDPTGVEVRAAASSEGQAPATAAEMETQKTPGNTIQIETPEQVLADRQTQATPASRNESEIARLHSNLDALTAQIAADRQLGFEGGRPRPGEEAAAARERLRDLEAKRQDASDELMNFTPEEEPAPPTVGEQRDRDGRQSLQTLLEEVTAKRKAAEAVLDSLREEGPKLQDEDGNTVEREPRSEEAREAYRDAKAEVAQLRRQEDFLKKKIANPRPAQEVGAPVRPLTDISNRTGVPEERLQRFEEEGQRTLVPELQKDANDLAGEPVRVQVADTASGAPSIVIYDNNTFGIKVPPRYMAEALAVAGGNESVARANVRKIFNHELDHLHIWKVLKQEWMSLDPATRGNLHDYISNQLDHFLYDTQSEIYKLRQEGKHADAFALEKAVRSAVEGYDQQEGAKSGKQLLSEMRKDPAQAWKYANEMLRQFKELRDKKQLSETFIQRVIGPLTEFFKRVRDDIQRLYKGVAEGNVSPTAKRILEAIDRDREQAKPRPERPSIVRLRKEVEGRSQTAVNHLEDNVIPWYGQSNENQHNRQASRAGAEDYPLAAAQDVLADNAGANGQLPAARRNEAELDQLARSSPSRLIDGSELLAQPDKRGGAEHVVVFRPEINRVIKLTRPGQAGAKPAMYEDIPGYAGSRIGLHNADPADYLDRVRLSNELFGDQQRYHGVWLDKNGEPAGLVISQPFVHGTEPTPGELSDYMKRNGFRRLDLETWYHPETGVLADDVAPRNVVKTKDGIMPIDIPLKQATPEERAHAEDVAEPQELGSASGPKINAAIAGAKKTISEKTKEYRYIFNKQYRNFTGTLPFMLDAIETHANTEGARVADSIYSTMADAGGGKFEKPMTGLGHAGPELERNAELTFPLVQSGFGRAVEPAEIEAAKAKLASDRARIEEGLKSSDPKVVRAMERLKRDWDPAAEAADQKLGDVLAWSGKVNQETNRQLAERNAAGIESEGIDDYIKQQYEQDVGAEDNTFVPNQSGGGYGLDKGALKGRFFPDAITAAEAGYTLKDSNVARLVGQGEAANQKLIGTKALENDLRALPSPLTGKPVLAEPESHTDANGNVRQVPPKGYKYVQGFGGQNLYVEQNLAPFFNTLFAPSAVRNSFAGRQALKFATNLKSGTLLFDSYHAARVYANLAGFLGQAGDIKDLNRFIKHGTAALDLRPEELDNAVRQGRLTQADADAVAELQKVVPRMIKSGTNVGKQLDNLFDEVGKPFFVSLLNAIPGLKGKGLGDRVEQFNKFVFQKQARGAMVVAWNAARERNEARFGKTKTEAEIDRMTSKEVNETFGNIGRQGLLKSKTAQDIGRLFVLASQWNDARFRFQGRALGQLARAPLDLIRGNTKALGNAGGTLLALSAGAFAANQVLNYATRGQPTWQNPEDGHKLDAWVPGGKNGFFYSPFNLAAEDIHALAKYGSRSSPLDALKRVALNKASGISRAGAALAGIDSLGRPLPGDASKLAQAGKNLLPIPIFAGPITSPILNPELSQKGDAIRQAAGMVGLKLDRAESPEQQLRAKAAAQFPSQFPKTESPGDYARLRSFVSNEKVSDASKEVLRLIAAGKTEQQILHSFDPTRPIKSRNQDNLLMRAPGAAALLPQVRQDRTADFNFLRQAIAVARQSPKYQEAVLSARKIKQPAQ